MDGDSITQMDAWTVIDSYFEEKGLVRQQIDSFNEFVDCTIQEIVDDNGSFTVDGAQQYGIGQDHSQRMRVHVALGKCP